MREIITGPSAFVIPLAMLHVIKKHFGRGNNVKLNYIDGFQKPFTEFAQNNTDAIKNGTANKAIFYKRFSQMQLKQVSIQFCLIRQK